MISKSDVPRKRARARERARLLLFLSESPAKTTGHVYGHGHVYGSEKKLSARPNSRKEREGK